MARIAKQEPRSVDKDDTLSQTQQYIFYKKQVEYFQQQMKDLRENLFSVIDDSGEKDDKGNIIFELPKEIEGFTSMTKQRRVSRKIDEDVAFEIIDERGLRDKLIKTVEVIDEDALMAALYSDELTEEEVDEMYPQTVVWALVMNKR
jgi:hypothetical protein